MVEFRRRELAGKKDRLLPAANRAIQQRDEKLKSISRMLESLSYERVLDRGFSVVKDSSGHIISSVSSMSLGDEVALHFADGTTGATITDAKSEPFRKPVAPKQPKAKKRKDTRQGDLF